MAALDAGIEVGIGDTGWLARVSAIAAFRQGSSLTVTATVYCQALP